MSGCEEFAGTAEFWLDGITRDVTCGRADPQVHITNDLVGEEVAKSLVEDLYVLAERCPKQAHAWHAVRKERPLPTWTRWDIERRARELRAARRAREERW